MLRCGIDMLEIKRVAEGIDRFGERFLNRFFTPQEQLDCENQAHRLAARIAAKEAVAKALGTGIGDVSWKEIEVRSTANGRPELLLHGNAAKVANDLDWTEWDLSLSHSEELATAMFVAH